MPVSVIVPIYSGIGYIPQIIKQVEKNAIHINRKVELIFVNDNPAEKMTEYKSNLISVIYIQNENNLGIHASRIKGLKFATGEFILFLDQDDLISEKYLRSQLDTIIDCDASVCRLIHNKRLHYTDTFRFEEVVTKDFMLNNWCSIVSPGQVLLKRKSIPQEWSQRILKNNGADDYFLWLLMFSDNKIFAYNNDVLFEHVFDGKNTSEDTNKMMDSEDEMLGYFRELKPYIEQTQIDKLKTSLRRIHIKQLEDKYKTVSILEALYKNAEETNVFYSWIEEHKNKCVAIYGAGNLGLRLQNFLMEKGLKIKCFIDRNAKYIQSECEVYTINDCRIHLDSILLTINDSALKSIIESCFGCEVINVSELL